MNETVLTVSSDWMLFVTLGGVYLVTAVIPAIWLSVRQRTLDRFVRVWHPIAVSLSAVAGIAVIRDSWGIKLILIGIVIPLIVLGNYLGYLFYLWLKHRIKC